MTLSSCLATERGRRCAKLPAFNSKWCAVHEELQAKSLKSYKRVSFELEAFPVQSVHASDVTKCESPDQLQLWAECFRKKWVLTKRTIDSRTKHHLQFYSGGDASHQAFIASLTAQKNSLEEVLLCIDDRAYALLLSTEKAEWLTVPSLARPICDEQPTVPALEPARYSPALSSSAETSSTTTSEPEEGIFSDIATDEEGSTASCTSDCCPPAKIIDAPTYRQRVLAYLGYACYFSADQADFQLAHATIENIFRFVISRSPRLLVRARAAGCTSVECFLTSGELQEEDYARLWRAMKYDNIHQEGKISVHTIRNAISDAENANERDRKGAFIELLGGKVWKMPLEKELSERGWDHFYRFTNCSGCAVSVVRTFSAWARNRQLSRPGRLYASWSDVGESTSEAALHACGAVICGSYRKAKTGCLEHVKPKRKGLKSVWIERDTRNWVFLRFDKQNHLAQHLLNSETSDIAVFGWPDASKAQDGKTIWVSRLRSGYTAIERKAARWTTDASFKHSDCTHQRLLSTSPETYFHKGQPFVEGSVDLLVVDCGKEQSFDRFLAKLVDVIEAGWTASMKRECHPQTAPLNDKALYLARQFFREAV